MEKGTPGKGCPLCLWLFVNLCASFSHDSVLCFFQKSDHGSTSCLRTCKVDSGLYFRKHRTGSKMSFPDVALCLLNGQIGQPLFIFFAEIDGYFLHGCQDDQHIRVQFFRQQSAGKVFVDDRAGAG